MNKQMILKNWEIGYMHKGISGEVYGNPKFTDGTYVTTSPVVTANTAEQTVTTRSGSVYKLENPSPDYEEAFPNSQERFFADYERSVKESQLTLRH